MLSHFLVVAFHYVNILQCFYSTSYLGCFQFSSIINSAAMNIIIRVFWSGIFVGSVPQIGIAGSLGMCILSFS